MADKFDKIVETADKLYSEFEVTKLYDYLYQFKDCENDEILWRLARTATDKGKASGKADVKKACIYEAYGYVQQALKINKNNYACHKWYAILLDYTGEYEGTKKRISNAYLVKEHFLKAIELNPKDATSIHSLGYW
ncbi:hypothetical protein KUTeg_019313 [Tegillarca granosa]|uniref:Regulator of microtubule dynamics protein 1 n=1 Tax=Tegillarca granosa TaxID=220873 RepID=A0ABQ9EC73_TEGGR|nr:hypothetical protein KUTeg_019313 [Tegillarca granosa]